MFETDTFKRLKNKKQDNFPKFLFVHHSGGTDVDPLADTSSHTAKGMELWHVGKGWEGLGYHFVIHKDGDIWKGRPEHYHAAHAKGYNSQSIGICLSGNFDATMPTEAQEESLRALLKKLSAKYDIEPSKIRPHRSVANKTCYGNKLSDIWARELLNNNHECKPALEDAGWNETVDHLIKLIKQAQ
jgi:N-acetylmuramoyl-L-alanine amidase